MATGWLGTLEVRKESAKLTRLEDAVAIFEGKKLSLKAPHS